MGLAHYKRIEVKREVERSKASEIGGWKMDHTAGPSAAEQIVRERIRRKVNEVSSAARSNLSPVQDHINFTLQRAYFKCAYECFDRTRTNGEISRCAENCSTPITNAQNQFENEMSLFQERLNRSLVVCQDKFEAAKLQKTRDKAVDDLEHCVNQTVDDSVKMLPHLLTRLKKALSIRD
ncbi:PREDICTED: protein FAM136A [Tarenaya hassleriana]|uniref:protein FAM136A n=1 Tax=Tarenaya hassleriana TaxID=28532 RepID=UPI00053C4E8C|nr:PREDICTED: protein FAM136A [Tarenaya hassleriana]